MKAVLLGRPRPTEQLGRERIPKRIALAVFSSDALSSSAYATEQILGVLIVAGAAALTLSLPIALAITFVLGVVTFSYRQTIHAYPGGGGAYIVAHENLGRYPGLVAAAALLIDYVLTVAVSVAAGVAAIVSAAPLLQPYRVPLALGAIVVVTLLNLRGVRESGTVFAVPTYAFVLLLGLTIVWGLVEYVVLGRRTPAAELPAVTAELTAFLVLKAFANGCAALTGVEAISNGVQAFREPASRNAATTMTIMAALLAALFLGVTVLARLFGIEGATPDRTVVALIALRVFGENALFFAVQAATALILFLAANTSFADFPRLSALLARDRYAPRQLMNRGDRLAYSNGILALGALASVLIVVYRADVTLLIHLYVVGVFTSFTLSQAGMVKHWLARRHEEPRWRHFIAINAFGATCTAAVLAVVILAKFTSGAWIVVALTPVVVLLFAQIHRHYAATAILMRDPLRRPVPFAVNHVVVVMGRDAQEDVPALDFARRLRPHELRCLLLVEEGESALAVQQWEPRLRSTEALDVVPLIGSYRRTVVRYARDVARGLAEDEIVTLLLADRSRRGFGSLLASRRTLALRAALLFVPRVVAMTATIDARWRTPRRHLAYVLVGGVHNPMLQALEYARTLAADEVGAVHVALDESETEQVTREWNAWDLGLPLTVLPAPYRDLAGPLLEFTRRATADGQTVLTVVLPEYVLHRRWQQVLHNRIQLSVLWTFMAEARVVVASVPYELERPKVREPVMGSR